jgi:hypothetical protein
MGKNLSSMVWDFTKALAEHAADGFERVDPTVYRKRMETCLSCEHYLKEIERCGSCGCYMPVKAGWRTSMCPLPEPKWTQDAKEQKV